jgi:hypothetical protein
MALTKEQLEAIVNNPLANPSQIVMARAQLAVLDHAEAKAKPEPEIDTKAGTVRLRGYQGVICFKPGSWFCKEGSKDVMTSHHQDIPARVISQAYADKLQHEYEAFGGFQSPQAQSIADMRYTVGRELATTPEEQAAWLAAFPNERRDLFKEQP